MFKIGLANSNDRRVVFKNADLLKTYHNVDVIYIFNPFNLESFKQLIKNTNSKYIIFRNFKFEEDASFDIIFGINLYYTNYRV